MILAAAERQALRQATPLGGLLAEGEDARIADADVVEEPEAEQELTEQEVADLVEAIEGAGWSEENARMRLVAAGAGDVTDLATGVRSLRRAQALEIIAQLTGADGPPLGGDLDAVPRPDASDGD